MQNSSRMNHNTRPAALSLERAVSLERLARARFFAYNQKRTMPPRINPIGILLLIITAGVVFIGLTITIVANWPGLASIGENRLKIAGPVLLCIGFLAFLATAIFMCLWASKQNKKWEKDMTLKAHQFLSASQSQEPLMDAGNNYSDPRQNGRVSGEHRMVVNGIPVDHRPSSSKPAGRTKKTSSPDGSGNFHDVSLDSLKADGGAIPAPVRVQKKRSSTHKGEFSPSNGSTNQSFSAGEGDMSIPGVSFGSPRGSIQPTNGFGRSPGSPIYSNENEIENYVRRVTTTTTTKTTRMVRPDNRRDYDQRAVDPIRQAIDNGRGGYGHQQQGLRVLIKATPSTAVHITPSSTPPTGGHPTRVTMDTEI